VRFYTSPSRLQPSDEKERLSERENLPSTWYGCLNPKDVEYRAISFRYALALFCLIFARESDLGSYRSFRKLFKVCVGRVRYNRPSQVQVLAHLVRIHRFEAWNPFSHVMSSSPSHYSHIKVTGLPKTALPQDVRRLVQTRNLENVSGSESVTSSSYPGT
jgi:hypothetical protein